MAVDPIALCIFFPGGYPLNVGADL
jgi:hypothetical protein